MGVPTAADIHRAVEARFNAGDVDGLVALYEPDAKMVGPDGTVAEGLDAIRATWEPLVALGGHLKMVTRYVVEMGDVALLRNDWSFEGADLQLKSETTEVARRQPGGTWLYTIDHPYGASADLP